MVSIVLESQSLQPSSVVTGDIVKLKTTHDKHWHGLSINKQIPDSPAVGFADALNNALTSVNNGQVNAEALVQKLVSDPKSVNLHEVLVASEKARMALTFTKTISDLVVRTYRELINLR